ncbi:MAG: hypothetical protein MH472_12820 [Bacteroidia bacterium]|nr:hypothetical protein [Bacteroidia bacterium]
MKKIVLLLVSISLYLGLYAQVASPENAVESEDNFMIVPATANKNNSFKIMKEPVLATDFQEFVNYLYSLNRIADANMVVASISKDLSFPTKYIILSNGAPIAMYAEYLSKKLSTHNKKVSFKLVSEQQWKQAKGMPDTYDVPKRNPYGLIFQQGVFEWKLNSKGEVNCFTDINGYQRCSFRLVKKETTTQTNKKK